MLSYFRWVLFFVALFVTLMGGALWLGNQLLGAAGPLDKTKNIVIPRGAGPQTMAKVLKEEGVIDHERLFRVGADDRSDAQAHQGGRVRDPGPHLHAGRCSTSCSRASRCSAASPWSKA